MRILVIAAVVCNTVVALSLAVTVYAGRSTLSARYKLGFPSDMLVLENRLTKKDVVLTLDNRFSNRVVKLTSGLHVFEVQRSFADARDVAPEWGYLPVKLHVSYQGGKEEIEILPPSEDE